jgi:hypothetical protein
MKTYHFKFLCGQCRNIYGASCNVPLDENFTGFIKGFLCLNCYGQMKLDKVFRNE